MKSYHVVGIGNAIVDVFTQADDSFIELMGIEKGIMQLVERDRGEVLYGAMTDRVQAPGGSVANTLAAIRAGTVTLVNALGVGVLESQALLAFLPGIARALNGRPLKLPNIATWWCGQQAEPDQQPKQPTVQGLHAASASRSAPGRVCQSV
jgi:hypothetical protein